MTDKQIIIDGVDVSGCKHYKHNDKNSGWSGCASKDEEHIHSANPLCCEKKDCLYKQLKAKEQECEGLGQAYLETNELLQEKTKECTNLKAENDLLKQECDNWEQQVLFADEQIDKMQDEIHLLQQYKKSKQASYESMQIEWNKAVSQNQDLLKQNENWQKEYWKLEQGNDFLAEKNSRLMSCLTEIKEIAESITYGGSKCLNCGEKAKNCADCMDETIEQMLQKISEVIKDEE